MRLILYFCFITFTLASGAASGSEPSEVPSPQGLVWTATSERIALKPGQTAAEATFKFKNQGDHAIQITQVRSSCGCTVVKIDDKTIEPGKEGGVVVAFNATGRHGRQIKHIIIRTNDPEHPVTTLTMDVAIPEVLRIQPTFVHWQIGDPQQPRTVQVEVLKPYELADITLADDAAKDLDIALLPGESDNARQVQIKPTATEPAAAMTKLKLLIKLKTGETLEQTIHVRPPQ